MEAEEGLSQTTQAAGSASDGQRKQAQLPAVERSMSARGHGENSLPETTSVKIALQTKAEQEAQRRAAQQAVVAELGLEALNGTSLEELMEMAVQQVARMLEVEYAKILQLLPDGDALLLLKGVGWQEGLVGSATVGTKMDSQAGYTLASNEPVIVADLASETRFNGPALLTDHDVVSGVSVVIQGQSRPFGVFGAHTRARRDFSQDDASFLQSVANVVGAAIERQRAQDEREQLLESLRRERAHLQVERLRLEAVLQQMPAGVIIAEAPSGRLVMGNDRVHEIWRRPYQKAGSVEEYARYPMLRADGTPLSAEERPLPRAISRGEVLTGAEITILRGDGTHGVISISAAPVYDESGDIVAGVVVFQDVTERKKAEEERRELLEELKALTETLEERVEERTRELVRRTEQLRAVASALTVAEQRERDRISRVLHDDLQQLLYTVQMQTSFLESELEDSENGSLLEELRELQQLHDRAIAVTRSLTVELNPPVLQEEGLVEALRWLSNHMASAYDLQVNVWVYDDVEVADNDLRELLFQMVRELLFNVVKHAGVNQARVTLMADGAHCKIVVSDDGRGFDPTSIKDERTGAAGYGLRSIAQRLELFDGALKVESEPGEGTRVTLSVLCPGP